MFARRSIDVLSVRVWVNSSKHSSRTISISETASQRGMRSTEEELSNQAQSADSPELGLDG